jgi:hypothetical protein
MCEYIAAHRDRDHREKVAQNDVVLGLQQARNRGGKLTFPGLLDWGGDYIATAYLLYIFL